MALKPNGETWTIREQIVEDPVTRLTFQFEVVAGTSARYRLRIYGDIDFGNREILFDGDGIKVGAGTVTAGLCKPSWLEKIDC